MNKILSVLLGFTVLFGSCSKDEIFADKTEVPSVNRLKAASDESILAKALLYTQWADVPTIMSSSYNTLRNTIIANLDVKCNNSLSSLQAMSENDLAWSALMHKFLLDGAYRTYAQLQTMLLTDYRNTII